jgi:hypothetical protein
MLNALARVHRDRQGSERRSDQKRVFVYSRRYASVALSTTSSAKYPTTNTLPISKRSRKGIRCRILILSQLSQGSMLPKTPFSSYPGLLTAIDVSDFFRFVLSYSSCWVCTERTEPPLDVASPNTLFVHASFAPVCGPTPFLAKPFLQVRLSFSHPRIRYFLDDTRSHLRTLARSCMSTSTSTFLRWWNVIAITRSSHGTAYSNFHIDRHFFQKFQS